MRSSARALESRRELVLIHQAWGLPRLSPKHARDSSGLPNSSSYVDLAVFRANSLIPSSRATLPVDVDRIPQEPKLLVTAHHVGAEPMAVSVAGPRNVHDWLCLRGTVKVCNGFPSWSKTTLPSVTPPTSTSKVTCAPAGASRRSPMCAVSGPAVAVTLRMLSAEPARSMKTFPARIAVRIAG